LDELYDSMLADMSVSDREGVISLSGERNQGSQALSTVGVSIIAELSGAVNKGAKKSDEHTMISLIGGGKKNKRGKCGWSGCGRAKRPTLKVGCTKCLNRAKNAQGYCCEEHWTNAHSDSLVTTLQTTNLSPSSPIGQRLQLTALSSGGDDHSNRGGGKGKGEARTPPVVVYGEAGAPSAAATVPRLGASLAYLGQEDHEPHQDPSGRTHT
jgi:uncharacterized low-complexity protein